MVSLTLGVMYLFAFFIEIYGITAVSMVNFSAIKATQQLTLPASPSFQQRLGLIRVYVYLAFLASLLVIGAGITRGVSYFSLAVSSIISTSRLVLLSLTPKSFIGRASTGMCFISGGRSCV